MEQASQWNDLHRGQQLEQTLTSFLDLVEAAAVD